jgi:hypothetical protein
MFFSWIRKQARDAILSGVSDALEELDRDATPADVDAARKRFAVVETQKQLPAAADEGEPGGKKRKAG